MRIFLTGASGYIGKVLARRFAADGHEVRCLVRSTSATGTLERLGVDLFTGDITERVSMREGMSGADWVVHAAAELDLDAAADRMQSVNALGSENVASLAYKLGIGRFLSVSSIAYFGGSPADGSPATEETPPRFPLPTRYSATKHAGERAIRTWAEEGLRVNTVYPSLVYGPPAKREGVNSVMRALLAKRLPVMTGLDRISTWIFIDDLVEGIVRVMERAPVGEAYLMAGERATLREVMEKVCALGGVEPPRWKIPLGLARIGIGATQILERMGIGRARFTQERVNSLASHWHFDDSKARRDLDWKPRGLDEGLPPTVEHLKKGL